MFTFFGRFHPSFLRYQDNFIGVIFSSSGATPAHRKSKLESSIENREKKAMKYLQKDIDCEMMIW